MKHDLLIALKSKGSNVLGTLLICTLFYGCTNDLLVADNDESAYPALLKEGPVILKMSYIEDNVRYADFPDKSALELGLTFIEEPKSEKKQVYIEVFDDFSVAKSVEYLPSERNYSADNYQLSSDMPEVKKFTYVGGAVKGYDQTGKLIFESDYEERPWLELAEFDSREDALLHAVNTFYNPKKAAPKALEMAKEGTSNLIEDNNASITLVKNVFHEIPKKSARNRSHRGAGEVTEEKVFLLPEYGVVHRVEGYTANGDLKDVEQNYFSFNEDSVMYLKSSHFINKQYSEAYDTYFIERSNTFYENFRIETTLNLKD